MLVVTGHCLLKFELDGFHSVGASIQAIHTDWSDDHLFTADSDGCVKVGVRSIRQRGDSFPPQCRVFTCVLLLQVWEIERRPFRGMPITPLAMWRAHQAPVTSISYIEQTNMLETFVVTASVSGEICVWTLTGIKVGMFGQEKVRLATS